MDIKGLRSKLKESEDKYNGDTEAMHLKQDDLLLEYINDKKTTEIFRRRNKWYA